VISYIKVSLLRKLKRGVRSRHTWPEPKEQSQDKMASYGLIYILPVPLHAIVTTLLDGEAALFRTKLSLVKLAVGFLS